GLGKRPYPGVRMGVITVNERSVDIEQNRFRREREGFRRVVHSSGFSLRGSCSGSVPALAARAPNIEQRTQNKEPNMNTNGEARTWKCELRLHRVFFELHQRSVLDADAQRVDVVRLF